MFPKALSKKNIHLIQFARFSSFRSFKIDSEGVAGVKGG